MPATHQTIFQWQYQPVKTIQSHPDTGTYTAYGLALYQCENGHRQAISQINDISVNQEFVENLALQFTLHQLSPVHFLDAILDSLQ